MKIKTSGFCFISLSLCVRFLFPQYTQGILHVSAKLCTLRRPILVFLSSLLLRTYTAQTEIVLSNLFSRIGTAKTEAMPSPNCYLVSFYSYLLLLYHRLLLPLA